MWAGIALLEDRDIVTPFSDLARDFILFRNAMTVSFQSD
jgi:hypothetical protein